MADAHLFSGGLLFDGMNAPQPGLGVMVQAGRITAVEPESRFAGWTGTSVDCSGGTLLPGLIDAHIHLALEAGLDPVGTLRSRPVGDLTCRILENAAATLAGGVTSARDLGGFDWLEVSVRQAIAEGRQVGPTLRCAGRVITITGGHGAWIGESSDGPDAWRRAVRLNAKNGADCIKLMATGGVLTPGVEPQSPHPNLSELTAATEMAHDLGLRVAVHAQGAAGIRRALLAGVDSIEHGFELEDDLIAMMLDRGVFLSGTLSSMDQLVRHSDRLSAEMRAKVERWHVRHFASFRRFVQAGGRMVLGTDAGTPGNHHGANAGELALMVDLGMTPLAALQAGTREGADLLNLPDRGRIAVGAAADLLLVEGNPVDDISRAADRRNHRALWKDGRAVRTVAPVADGPLYLPAAAAGF
jgi:imidazolonepropionase-like amidohydrolase